MIRLALVLAAVAFGFTPDRTPSTVTKVCATADTVWDDLPTETTATGMSWTPASNATYRVSADVVFTAAATTTGMQGRLDPGNATTGACYGVVRNSSSTTASVYTGSVGTTISTNDVLGSSSANTFTRLQYSCLLQAAASPTALAYKFHTEVDTSAVTVKAGLSCLWIERLQ